MLNIRKKIINIIQKKRIISVNKKIKLWNKVQSKKIREQLQKEKFNFIWSYAYSNFEFYKNLKEKYKLPNLIEDIKSIREFPLISKKNLINYDFKNLKIRKKFLKYTSTGGTSGMILSIPQNIKDSNIYHSNMYHGRSWHDFSIGDKIIFIWGHSNQFKTNSKVSYLLNFLKTNIKDKLININRFSAYNLSENNYLRIINCINNSNEKINIVTYSSFMRNLCYFIKDSRINLKLFNIKNIILTSEIVYENDVKLILNIFKILPILEYGMAEFGPLAYSKKNNLEFFWDSYYTYTLNNRLSVTNLDNVYFPLINYDTEDLVEGYNEEGITPYAKKIIGRANDNLDIKLKNGNIQIIHSEFFTHIIKNIKNVRKFKILNKKNKLIIFIESSRKDNSLYNEIKDHFFIKLKNEFPDIDINNVTIRFEKIVSLTVSGKEKFIEKI